MEFKNELALHQKNYNNKCVFNKGKEAQQMLGQVKNRATNPTGSCSTREQIRGQSVIKAGKQHATTNRGRFPQVGGEAECKDADGKQWSRKTSTHLGWQNTKQARTNKGRKPLKNRLAERRDDEEDDSETIGAGKAKRPQKPPIPGP
jgi:hypothetical protein